MNGITTIGSFITQQKNGSLKQAVNKAKRKASGNCYCDYFWHLTPTVFNEKGWKEIIAQVNEGFKTIKLYTTYRQAGIYSSYRDIERIFKKLKRYEITFLIHCEDDEYINKTSKNGFDYTDTFSYTKLRSEKAESIAVKKIIETAKRTGSRIHIVHVTSRAGINLINENRNKVNITCETAPHYLFLNNEKLKGKEGYKWFCTPPLRNEFTRKRLYNLALKGYFDIYATDHCAFSRNDKNSRYRDIRRIPSGVAGLGALSHLIYKLHSNRGNKGIIDFARHLSTNPAKIFGLYPQKGVIKIGSDADLAIINPKDKRRMIKSSLSDTYETYKGYVTNLEFKYVILRGNIIVLNNQILKNKKPEGKHLWTG